MERAEVAEEKRSVFRALTRLRGAAITSFDGVARSQTGNIDEYNKTHKWRKTHPLHHLMQYELVRGVNDLDGKPLAIGLEMCYRQHQPALDAFVFGGGADGGGSFSELKKRVKWRKTWGYDINQYAKIFSYARQNGIRLVGLNVPYGMVQMVSNFGLRKLPDELRGCARAIPTARNSLGAQFCAQLSNALPPTFSQVPARNGPL